MKTETCKLYSRVFWIFLPNVIKIDSHNFELYRFKVGAFLRHSTGAAVDWNTLWRDNNTPHVNHTGTGSWRAGFGPLNDDQEEMFIKRRHILQVDKTLNVQQTVTICREVAWSGDQLLLEYVDQLDVPPILPCNAQRHWYWSESACPFCLLIHFNAHCCHFGTAVMHPVPDRVKTSFAIFDIWALWRSGLGVRVPGCQKLEN